MNHRELTLIHGYLDGMLTSDEEVELGAWIKVSPENAKDFAEMVRLHDRLRDMVQVGTPVNSVGQQATINPTRVTTRPIGLLRRRARMMGGVAALMAIASIAIWWVNPEQISAASELERLIDRSTGNGDRSYIIRSLDPAPLPQEPRQPPIDGAKLFIRPPGKYVLIRSFPDGRPYVTGSDGEVNWDVPPAAPVRLSRDPFRFRWPLPGHQHGIPFADLRSDLTELRDAYELKTLAPDAAGLAGIQALKKSREYRGPNRVELWYDRSSGVIHRMVFGGLPRARGGPTSVAVELVEQRELSDEFFQHQAHHAADRLVIEED